MAERGADRARAGLGCRRVTGPLTPRIRRITARFAELACPPQVLEPGRVNGLLGEFEAMPGTMPAAARRLVPLALVLVDQSARLYPHAHDRRFARLRGGAAQACLRAALARRQLSRGRPWHIAQRQPLRFCVVVLDRLAWSCELESGRLGRQKRASESDAS